MCWDREGCWLVYVFNNKGLFVYEVVWIVCCEV